MRKALASLVLCAVLGAPFAAVAQTAPAAPAPPAVAAPPDAAQQGAAPTGETMVPTAVAPGDGGVVALDPATGAPVGAASPTVTSLDDRPKPHDLSAWGMFMGADIIVKTVMVMLALASIATWTVWIAKGVEMSRARARVREGRKLLASARTLKDAAGRIEDVPGPVARLVREAKAELDLSADAVWPEGIKERVASRLDRVEHEASRHVRGGMGMLATIGAIGPFVGLFGTVWGIMNSFIGIAEANTTNLAVVAPGIAEALLATALGLVAAIPAVICYNVFARTIANYRALVADAAHEVLRMVGRDLDRAAASPQLKAAE
ncbi:tonB-system energizer ExbB [Zavarzinia sp. CC-PAN008]|uniref:tonB-system energizer ExbB n=1 Tax=Zavarzinia sp. CC-PAN008 TaxID=3243332 RepID=UPI003F745AE9